MTDEQPRGQEQANETQTSADKIIEQISTVRQALDFISNDIKINGATMVRAIDLKNSYFTFYGLVKEIIRQRVADDFIEEQEKKELAEIYDNLTAVDNAELYTLLTADSVYIVCLKVLYGQNNRIPYLLRRVKL